MNYYQLSEKKYFKTEEGRLYNAEGYDNDDMHFKIFSKMQNLKSTVFPIVPIFHNSKFHVLTLYESSIQNQDKPVLGTQSTHPLSYYVHDGDVADISLRSIICTSFPKA